MPILLLFLTSITLGGSTKPHETFFCNLFCNVVRGGPKPLWWGTVPEAKHNALVHSCFQSAFVMKAHHTGMDI